MKLKNTFIKYQIVFGINGNKIYNKSLKLKTNGGDWGQ